MTNQPIPNPEAALQRLLESAFPPAFPSDPDAEKTIQWLAGNIDKGLCRVYAVNINECMDEEGHKRLVERVLRRIDDPQLIEQLKDTLAAPPQSEFVLLLAGIAFAEIDHILQQTKVLGREENFLHVQCTRVGNELIVLADRDSRYEWILPAVKTRVREELSNLHYERAAIETQSLDLSLGHRLRFLDYELRLTKDRHGEVRVRYRLVEKAKRRQAQKVGAHPLGHSYLLRWAQPCLDWLERWRGLRFIPRLCRKADAIVDFILGVCKKANSIQVGWRHLPITLFPVLMLLLGWRSPAPWLDFALIFACNWNWPLGLVRWSARHKLDTVMIACAAAALIFLSPLLRDIYANRPREVAASATLPSGFYLGEYHGDSWWQGEATPGVNYGLYVPPQFQGQKGPFPLIVFLHGYGERTKTRIFVTGLPLAIAERFGANRPYGPFEFVAFFPIDPTGRWQGGSAEVENIMTTLDYVIVRHRIDPSRVYLTGLSAGGSGVWELAQAYPDKWAAVAPVSSFISPEVGKVQHIPAWIFHGAKDEQAPVDRVRYLVQQLKDAGAEVHYTEIPDGNHFIWDKAYNPKELYEWLVSKKKD